MTNRILLAVLLLAALASGGCAPVTVSVTLFGDSARLWETEVARDPRGRQKVAIIDIRGVLAEQQTGIVGPRHNAVDELTARLNRAETDRQVAAVILRINSPGGTVASSDMMYREIREFTERSGKPVVASFGEITASGGYYLALAADHLIAEPTTITGSIGVIIPTFNFSQGLNRIGIHSRSVTSVANKDIANPFEPVEERHYAILQTMVDEFHGQFQGMVALRRGSERTSSGEAGGGLQKRAIDPDRLGEIADGRIMTGLLALQVGLVDETGGIREAFEAAKSLAGLEAARLVKYYREDSGRPRTAYAGPPPSEGVEINLMQIRAPSLGLGELQAGLAYYLYVPPGAM